MARRPRRIVLSVLKNAVHRPNPSHHFPNAGSTTSDLSQFRLVLPAGLGWAPHPLDIRAFFKTYPTSQGSNSRRAIHG